MLFSRNSVTGEVESYTDEGIFAGHVFTMGDFIGSKETAEDGGPGSGNYGHRGRPGKRGGSAKGSGGGVFRSGSKEAGYTSFAKHEEFQGILEAAREHRNAKNFSFAISMPAYNALKAQKDISSPDESMDSYMERIYKMLKTGSQEKKPKEGSWESNMTPEELDDIDAKLALKKAKTLGEVINHNNPFTNAQILKTIGDRNGWQEKLLERKFSNLDETERKNMEFLLDRFPYGDGYGEKYAKIPDETRIESEPTSEVRNYYEKLKAKELGIEGIDSPKPPEELLYAMTHKPASEIIAEKDSGYVHTEAGNKYRESAKQKLQDPNNIARLFGSTEAKKYKQAIIDSVDAMDDDLAELVDKTIDNANVNWRSGSGTCHYQPATGVINIYEGRNEEEREPQEMVRTFWHEYGHFIDDENYSKAGISASADPLIHGMEYAKQSGPTKIAHIDDQYLKAAKEDLQNFLKFAGVDDKFEAVIAGEYASRIRIKRKSDGQNLWFDGAEKNMLDSIFELQDAADTAIKKVLGFEEYEGFMRKHGEPEEPKYSDYFETYTTPKRNITRTREAFKGANIAYFDAMKEHQRKKEEWIESIGGQEAYQKLLNRKSRLYKKYEQRQRYLAPVTDSLDEACYGMLGMVIRWGGHDFSYYKYKDTVETTANIFQMRVTNDPDSVKFMKKLIPNISAHCTRAWRMKGNEGDQTAAVG